MPNVTHNTAVPDPSSAKALLTSGTTEEVIRSALEGVVLAPDSSVAWMTLAVTTHRSTRADLAIQALGRIAILSPGDSRVLNSLSDLLLASRRVTEAKVCSIRSLILDPSMAAPYARCAELDRQGNETSAADLSRAVTWCTWALAIERDNLVYRFQLGTALQEAGRLQEALAVYDTALALYPGHADVLVNRGNAIKDLFRPKTALQIYYRALRIKPHRTELHANIGLALKELHRLDEAIDSLNAAICAKPDYADAYWNKALALLLSGRFAEGWDLYEWRWQRTGGPAIAISNIARQWDGESSIAGRSLLIHSEQGLGDTLQFCGLFHDLSNRGANISVLVDENLKSLLRSNFSEVNFVTKNQPLPSFAFHIPLMSLPRVLGCNLLGKSPFATRLKPPTEKVLKWSELVPPSEKLRVGLAWSGNPRHHNDRNRSISLERLLAYLPPDAQYFCLQRDVRSSDLRALRESPIRNFAREIENFADTAGLCSLMDVVVSVDTSVAHLAAAMGQRCWILLPFLPDWRWQLHRPDCPWYPTVELFRQPENRSWKCVLERVARRIKELSDRGTASPDLKDTNP